MKHLLILLISMPIFVKAQLTPPLRNFAPDEYQGKNQIWSMDKSPEGDVFFANHDFLLVYDGHNWVQLKLEEPTIFRSVKFHNDVLYSGGYMHLGFWTVDSNGNYNFESILDKLKIPVEQDESFWNINAYKDVLIFQSLQRIIIVDQGLTNYKEIRGDYSNNSLVYVGETPFIIDIKKGIRPLFSPNNSWTNSPFINWQKIIGVVLLNEQRHLVNSNGIIYKWSTAGIELSSTYSIAFDDLYAVQQLKNGDIIFGTIGNGVEFYDRELRSKGGIKRINGLLNNTVLSVFEDQDQNLWLGLDRGIALINYASPNLEYRNSTKDIGSVYTAVEWNNEIIVGTNQGVYHFDKKANEFYAVSGVNGQIWKLDIIGQRLFCSANDGLYEIDQNLNLNVISEETGFWNIKKIPGYENLYLAGSYQGIYVFDLTKERWETSFKTTEYKSSSRFFEIKENTVIINNEYLGVIQLNFTDNYDGVIEQFRINKKGQKSSLITLDNFIYYKSDQGIFRVNTSAHQLEYEPMLSSIFEPETIYSSTIFMSANDSYFTLKSNALVEVYKGIVDSTYKRKEYLLPNYVLKNLGNSGFENVNYLAGNRLLIGLSDGFVILDLNKNLSAAFNKIKLNSVAVFTSGSWKDVSLNGSLVVPSNSNSIRFNFKSPFYNKYQPVEFNYQLFNNFDTLTSYTTTPQIQFINLKPGVYKLKVEVTTNFINKHDSAIIDFEITPPWYLNKLSIAAFISLLVAVLTVLLLFTRRYFKKRERALAKKNQQKLEMQQLRDRQVVNKLNRKNLEIELNNKKRELAITAENILSKNRLLHNIREKLAQIEKDDGVNLKSLLEFIDQNIKEKKGWGQFEKAFNDYDKDFVERVKIKFGNQITQQDLLLITYIRTGLSSKDIAQVLNISVKSVEMKRYRLRKKMNIISEISLVDYINNL